MPLSRRLPYMLLPLCAAALAASNPVYACENNPKANIIGARTVTIAAGTKGIQLDGHSSKGDAYLWTQTAGTSPVTIRDANKDIASFDAPNTAQTLAFTLTATGCSPKQDTQTVTYIVTSVNLPPIAAAYASPSSVNEGSAVTLFGEASYDPDGDPLTYSWQQTAGPAVTLSSLNTRNVSFTAPDVGTTGATLEFKLTVSDGPHDDYASVTVNVIWVNQSPTAAATCSTKVWEGDPIKLDGSASRDVDDGIASWIWSQTFGGPTADLTGQTSVRPDPSVFSFNAPSLNKKVSNSSSMVFNLTVTDNHGLYDSTSCTVMVEDVTPPYFTSIPSRLTVEATSKAGATVNYLVSADDAFDPLVTVACNPATNSPFAFGETGVSCTARDTSTARDPQGNAATGSFIVEVVDTTPPTLYVADMTVLATNADGSAVVNQYDASANDIVDGPVPVNCTPAAGATFKPGTNTVTCSATDSHGNTSASMSFTVKVSFTPVGFFSPVSMSVKNSTKAGSTVPLKWKLQGAGGIEITNTAVVKGVYVMPTGCEASEWSSDVAATATGGTTLRYDLTSMQFVYNWQTPRAAAGTCYAVEAQFVDGGATQIARFQLK